MDANETLFLVKPEDEFCFLWAENRPRDLFRAMLECADSGRSRLTRDEALEVIEDIVLDRLRRI